MKRRILPIMLIIVFALTSAAAAASPRINWSAPALTFKGTTAQCEISITKPSASIAVTLELWNGSSMVKSWTGKGTGTLTVTGTYAATKGTTYTLKANGTINGESFTTSSVSGQCR